MIKEFHKSKNLFDATAVSKGRINSTTGAIEYAEDTPTLTYSETNNEFTLTTRYAWRGFVTEYLDLQEKPAFSYISDDGTFFAFSYAYDANKNFLGVITSSVPTGTKYIRVSIQCSTVITNAKIKNIMLNSGSSALPYEPYGDTWNTKSYAKIVDTTQQVTSFPVVVRPMESTIPSWTIKGNLVQDGTPSPSNIIYPSETGERTGNLLELTDSSATANTLKTLVDFGTDVTYDTFTCSCVFDNLEAENGYGAFIDYLMDDGTHQYVALSGMLNVNDDTRFPTNVKVNGNYYNTKRNITFRKIQVYLYTTGYNNFKSGIIKWAFYDSEKKDYEPYGYKIPILSANTTTPVYLGEVESTRRIKKLVLTGEEGWVKTQTGRYYINASTGCPTDYLKQTITTSICSHYQSQNNTASGSNQVEAGHFCFYTGGGFELYIGETTISSAADFKTYLQQQYAAGTPVTIWYVLATEATTTLNDPLRKIGTYSDSVSGTNLSVIAQSPTTIDVDTTLKPSEMDLTYTGLKMCGRKKYAHGNSPQILPSAEAGSETNGNATLTCDGNGTYTYSGIATSGDWIRMDIDPITVPLGIDNGGNGAISVFNNEVSALAAISFWAVTPPDTVLNEYIYTFDSQNIVVTNYAYLAGKVIKKVGVNFRGDGAISGSFSPMITNDGQLPSTFQPYCSWQ